MVGTKAMLSGTGARLVLDDIPRPPRMALLDWIKAFLSYGFLLCVEEPALSSCLGAFHRKGIAAQVIGDISSDRRVTLCYEGGEAVLFDFTRESITGIRRNGC